MILHNSQVQILDYITQHTRKILPKCGRNTFDAIFLTLLERCFQNFLTVIKRANSIFQKLF